MTQSDVVSWRARMGAPGDLAEAVDEERSTVDRGELAAWVARELHDAVAQSLTTVLTELELMSRGELSGAQRRRLGGVESEARAALSGLREVVHRLRGEPLVHAQLVESVASLLEDFEHRTSIVARFRHSSSWPRELPSDVALNIRRIVEEALANVRRHSGASSVEVSFEVDRSGLVVTVADDGRGNECLDGALSRGMGIAVMRERAAILGGTLEVVSRSGLGTVVSATAGWMPPGATGGARAAGSG